MNSLTLSPTKFTANPKIQISQDPTNLKDETKKNNLSNQSKILIGLGALASIAVGGILLHRAQVKTLTKKAAELAKEINSLPAQKPSNVGTTVQETIQNVLGKNSSIRPHSYDTAKEFHTMHVYRNQGGYKDGIFTRNGVIDNKTYHSYPQSERTIIYEAAFGGNTNRTTNNKVVRLSVPDPKRPEDTSIIFTLISPNNKYTPAQLDLLKLVNNPDKIDVSILDKIFKFKPGCDANNKLISENIGKYENLDYDLVLSVIQSMASKI